MKKLIAIALALCVLCSFAACSNNEPEVKLPASALEILETVWASYADDEKFFAMGGGYENMVDNAPGSVLTSDTAALQSLLLIPEAELANVTEAASLVHGMNQNTFTAGAYKVADAAAFGAAMRDAIQNNMWMCGFPEKLLVVTFGNEYAVVVYGLNDAVNPFQTKLAEAYPDAVIAIDEPIA